MPGMITAYKAHIQTVQRELARKVLDNASGAMISSDEQIENINGLIQILENKEIFNRPKEIATKLTEAIGADLVF
jgi:hypothetical protein